MRTLFVRSFLACDLIAAAVLLAALSGCAREAPTGLTLQAAPPEGFFSGAPPFGSGQLVVGGQAGQPDTIALQVVDQNGRAAPDIPVSWAVVPNGGSASVASSLTDSNGTARVVWTLDTIAKTDSLRASIASGSAMLVMASVRHGTPVIAMKVSGDSQTVTLGEESQPFIVRLTDRFGNPVGGVAVGWIVTGGGTLSAITTATDTTGTSQVTLSTDPNAPGVHQIIATYGLARASTFTLIATSATMSVNPAKRIRVYTHPIP